MDETCAQPIRAARDPQAPVLDLNWVEIFAEDVYIAYVLIAGPNVSEPTLNTTKGSFTVERGQELWYSANVDVGDVTALSKITWKVQTFQDTTEGHTALKAAINASAGLTGRGAQTPALQAASGPVIWAQDELPDGLSSFEYETAAGEKWQLSLEQDGTALATVAWSTTDGNNNPTTTATALPAVFGQNGETDLNAVEDPQYDYIFTDYN